MNLLLVWPDSRNEVLGWGDLGAVAEPLALEYLAGGVAMDGHRTRILDLRLHPDGLDATVREFAPDMVGVTAYSMHVRRALEICARVKALNPECVTVAGGHHATLLPEDFFHPSVDHVVCGEGVAPLRAMLRSYAASTSPGDLPGVWTRRDGAHHFGGQPASLDIDSLPRPDRRATAAERSAYFIDWMRPVALIRTSVGCPFRCSFCSLWQIMDGRYKMRRNDAVVDELDDIKEDFVFLVDDEAFIHGRRMLQLARAIEAAGRQKRFFSYARVDSIVREQGALAAWRDVGLERLFVGIDAISEREMTEYNKRCQLALIEEALTVAERLGIEIFAQFVVSPAYTKRDFQQLVRFIEHHRIRYPSFTVLTPIPGSALIADTAAIVERQPNGRPNWDLFDCQNAVTKTRLPLDEFRREYRNLYHVFNGSYAEYRPHRGLIDEQSRSEQYLRRTGAAPGIDRRR